MLRLGDERQREGRDKGGEMGKNQIKRARIKGMNIILRK